MEHANYKEEADKLLSLSRDIQKEALEFAQKEEIEKPLDLKSELQE